MRVVDVKETWIHTHFITDARRISVSNTRLIKKKMEKLLRDMGIVFGIHFRDFREDERIRIVLECRPFPQDLKKIKSHLEEVIKDIPAHPGETKIKIQNANKK